MSHYTAIQTELKDKEVILEALKMMGFSCEVGKNLPLHDFLGRKTLKRADIVIPRKSLNTASNDIGIKKVNNHFEIIISDFDSVQQKTRDFVANLVYRYTYLKVKKELGISNFQLINEKVEEDGTIKIEALSQEA